MTKEAKQKKPKVETKVTGVNFVDGKNLTNGLIVKRVQHWIDCVDKFELAKNAAHATLQIVEECGTYDPIIFRYTGGLSREVKNRVRDFEKAKQDRDEIVAIHEKHLGEAKEDDIVLKGYREGFDYHQERLRQLRKSIRIPVDLWKQVESFARILSTTPSDIVRMAVDEQYLDSGRSWIGMSTDKLWGVVPTKRFPK